MGKPEGKRPLGRPRRRWEDNINNNNNNNNNNNIYSTAIGFSPGGSGLKTRIQGYLKIRRILKDT